MALTLRNDAKKQIIKILQEQGYPRYARLAGLFDIYLTDDPEVVGYMIPGKAKIVLNQELSINQVSVTIRHEILHEFLSHQPRKDKFHQNNPQYTPDQDLANIAADFDISNRGYTDSDKAASRAIVMGKKVVQGLVTEDHLPEWTKLSYEEMYEKLLKEKQAQEELLKKLLKNIRSVSKRDIEDLKDAAESAAVSPSNTADQKKRAQQIANELADIGNKIDASSSGDKAAQAGGRQPTAKQGDTNAPLQSSEAQQERVDVAARVAQIEQELNDPNAFNDIEQEIATHKRQDAIRRANKNARLEYARGGNGGLANFKLDLRRFVERECGEVEDRTYRRFNPSYEDSGFIVRTRTRYYDENIPVINVYWDTSSSFDDPKKTAGARAAINSIQGYEKKGLIKINVFYFNTQIHDKPVNGGTDGNCIIQHVQETKPDNVIVISDSDINNAYDTATVPGAVWCLFYDSNAPVFIKKLRGKRENKWYMIEYQ